MKEHELSLSSRHVLTVIMTLILIVTLGTFSSCNGEEDLKFTPDEVADSIQLSVSQDTVYLYADKANEPALKLTFGHPQKRIYNSKIKLYIQFSAYGSATTTKSDFIYIPPESTSYSLTNYALNNIVKRWGISGGTFVEIQVNMIAKAENDVKFVKPETSYKVFVVKTY